MLNINIFSLNNYGVSCYFFEMETKLSHKHILFFAEVKTSSILLFTDGFFKVTFACSTK